MHRHVSGRQAVLILDQEPATRALAETVFEYAGYLVLNAPTAREALKLTQARAGQISFVLADSAAELGGVASRLPVAQLALASDYAPVLASWARDFLKSGGGAEQDRSELYSNLVEGLFRVSRPAKAYARIERRAA